MTGNIVILKDVFIVGVVKLKKLLIVEDIKEIMELLIITVSASNFKIFEANSGEKAIEIALKEKPDLILMDIMLAGEMNGLEASKIIKNTPLTKNSKIIMLSSKGEKEDKELGYSIGVDAYFTKPFSPLDLILKIEDVLNP